MMPLEKLTFIERAVKVAGEEILEEISLSEEGSDPSNALSVIKKIVQDLLDFTENPSLIIDDEDSFVFEESSSPSYELPARPGHPFFFDLGESTVIIDNEVRYPNFDTFLKELEIDTELQSKKRPEVGTKCKVIARGPHLRWDEDDYHKTNVYVVQTDSGLCIYGENGLRKA